MRSCRSSTLEDPSDFAEAMALGADGIALSNAALQAIGCLGRRACRTNNCLTGIAYAGAVP